jgi:hypothetical protein
VDLSVVAPTAQDLAADRPPIADRFQHNTGCFRAINQTSYVSF